MSSTDQWSIRPTALICLATFLSISGTGHAGPLEDCLAETGLAHVTYSNSLLQAGSQWNWIFGAPGSGLSCDPPDAQSAELTAGGFKAAASYAAGLGSFLTTAALSSPGGFGGAHARFALDHYYAFEVVPDDPAATAPVTIDIVTRHRFAKVTADVSANGSAASALSAYHELRRLEDGVYVGPAWSSQVPVADGSFIDLFHSVEVPVNTPLYLLASIDQRSDSNAGGGGGGSGAAGANTIWSLEITTEAAADVVFDSEWQLGLASPSLDHVPEPDFASSLYPLALLLGWLARSVRRGTRREALLVASTSELHEPYGLPFDGVLPRLEERVAR